MTASAVVYDGLNSPFIPANLNPKDFFWLSSIFLVFCNFFSASSQMKGSASAPEDCNTILEVEAAEA